MDQKVNFKIVFTVQEVVDNMTKIMIDGNKIPPTFRAVNINLFPVKLGNNDISKNMFEIIFEDKFGNLDKATPVIEA